MKTWMKLVPFVVGLLLIAAAARPLQAGDNPNPPEETVKLIFIHHSTGENWLTDDYGNLGRTLDQNHYFVSDTNYGWGPDAIGDRTDIPNWTEWFASEDTPTYMDALFNENGQHSSYTRTLFDPGGENEIIMFKSCFPNSALAGSPNEAPDPQGELTVGHAKYVYNEILKYFATRPDKLFIVITQPPLSDAMYAANARAFTQWLLNDWLRENDYSLNNVFVFDFYNILTGPEGHHRYNQGQIEYNLSGRNTLYYPSGDDHPSVDGSQKATAEFVPLLNIFYHRWKENILSQPASTAPTQPQAESQPAALSVSSTIDDFDGNKLSGAYDWEGFYDEATPTTLSCEPTVTGRAGHALHLAFDIAANSWGTCAVFYDVPQDWSANKGLTFYFRTARAGQFFDVDLYAGPDEARETYVYSVEAPAESVNAWVPVQLRWEDFQRASWEENAGEVFARSNAVAGLAFGVGTPQDASNAGEIWVDDLQLSGAQPDEGNEQPEVIPTATTENAQPEADRSEPRPLLPCAGGIVLPLLFVVFTRFRSRKHSTPYQ